MLKYKRSVRQILKSVSQPLNYYSLARACVYINPVDSLFRRYVLGGGEYPATVGLRTPAGVLRVRLRSTYDMLTVHEIFAWRCYPCTGNERVILDLGANIGISMLYFLSHAPDAFVIGVEPLGGNLATAEINLRSFHSRFELKSGAVMNYEGTVEFNVEETGRYSGLASRYGDRCIFHAFDIDELVSEVIERHGIIDLVKVDIEGAEGLVLQAISRKRYESIRGLAIEGDRIPWGLLAEMGYSCTSHMSGVHWFARVECLG